MCRGNSNNIKVKQNFECLIMIRKLSGKFYFLTNVY